MTDEHLPDDMYDKQLDPGKSSPISLRQRAIAVDCAMQQLMGSSKTSYESTMGNNVNSEKAICSNETPQGNETVIEGSLGGKADQRVVTATFFDEEPSPSSSSDHANGREGVEDVASNETSVVQAKKQKTVLPPTLSFMDEVDGQVWKYITLDSVYVPKIGSSFEFNLIPRSSQLCGNILAIACGCGRGKSFVFREYMTRVLKGRPKARILLLSANILYGTNLAHELKQAGFDTGFYKEEETNLASHQIIVCSLESLHHIDGQRFQVMLIDEIRTISCLVGGETMPDFTNVFLLRELCSVTPEVVVCDADMLYKAHDSEPVPVVKDFLQVIAPNRSVTCATLSHPGPDHLKRKARLFYDFSKFFANGSFSNGKGEWFNELEAAADSWHENNENRFAICVGSKVQMREVCEKLKEFKIPFKPYSGDTNEKYRLDDLQDPDAAWKDVGAIVATTTLSIGVDPKEVQFARVFIWTHMMGCNVLTQAQAALRFGRASSKPLKNTTIEILVHGIPPQLRDELVMGNKRDPVKVSDYSEEFRRLQKKRARRIQAYVRQMASTGGFVEGVKEPIHITDQLLRLMAHPKLERLCQMRNMHGTIVSVCAHHNWEVVDDSLSGKVQLFVDDKMDVEVDEDDEFAALKSSAEKFEESIVHIEMRGEDGFFDECYGLAKDGYSGRKSSKEQWLVKTYWLVHNIGRIPSAGQLDELDRPGVKKGVELNALSRCRTPEEQMKCDRYKSLDVSKKSTHPINQVSLGNKMMAAKECAELVGVDSLFHEHTFPQEIVNMVNREKDEEPADADRAFLNRLIVLVDSLYNGNATALIHLLQEMAKHCGMKLETDTERKQKNGKRKRTILSISTRRLLPDIVEDWLVKSERLGGKYVRVGDWVEEHSELDKEEMELGLLCEEEEEDCVFAPCDTKETRHEKVDGVALANELKRLKDVLAKENELCDRDKRWLDWLEAADAVATPKAKLNETVPKTRYLTVTYGKRRVIGRRTASHPSSQHCPSGLRPKIFKAYHDADIVNCHPTLFAQVGNRIDVSQLAILKEYNEHRGAVLTRIAEFYGVPAPKCKYAVLRVLNGGSIMAWVRDARCPKNNTEEQTDLQELREVSRLVRHAFFNMPRFKHKIATLTQQVQTATNSKVEQAKAFYATAKNPHLRMKAKKSLDNAMHKASSVAVTRTVFSLCVFELEDSILNCIDEYFRTHGWTVGSLQFDGLQPEHRKEDTLSESGQCWRRRCGGLRIMLKKLWVTRLPSWKSHSLNVRVTSRRMICLRWTTKIKSVLSIKRHPGEMTVDGVLGNEDLVVKILMELPLQPDMYVKLGRVCKAWRNACRRDECLLMSSIRACEYLTKGMVVGLFGLTSREADRLARETCWRRGGGIMYKYHPVQGQYALDMVGGIEGLNGRLKKRARYERNVASVYGDDWKNWLTSRKRISC